MIFAVRMYDSSDAPTLRKKHLAEHLAYVETILPHILVAGALSAPDDAPAGSLAVLEMTDQAALEAAMKADPYWRNGVWDRYEILPYNPVVGAWVARSGA